MLTESSAPLVTVAVAAYNAAPFISRAIDSALNQFGVNLEVLVVDDASADGTAEFVRMKFAADSRVTVISLPQNVGPAEARNTALAQARGRWMAVLDADDAFEPGHLSDLVSLAESESADIIAGNFQYFDFHRAECVGYGLDVRSQTELLDKYSFVQGARPFTGEADFGLLHPLFRTDFLRLNGLKYPVDVRIGEDMELVFDALLAGAKYVVKRDLCSYLYTTGKSGHSRTQYEFAGIVKRTISFIYRPNVRSDRRLVRLIKERADAFQRLEFTRIGMGKSMSRLKITRLAMLSPEGRRWLLRRVAKKLFGFH